MLVTIALLLQITAASAPAELVRDPVVLAFCRTLMVKAASERFGEQGAFIVRTREGLLYFVAWPPGEEKDRLRWYGRFPEGTLAIVHTHPSGDWLPSKLDATVARRTGIPVYVLTPRRITRTAGAGHGVVVEEDWVGAAR